jgi:hypothetical protein
VPTVARARRVTELKNDSATSASPRAAASARVPVAHRRPQRHVAHGGAELAARVERGRVAPAAVERQPLGGVGAPGAPLARPRSDARRAS